MLVVITGTGRKSKDYGKYVEFDEDFQVLTQALWIPNAEVDGPMKLSGEALTGNLLARN